MTNYENIKIDKEKFEFVPRGEKIHDKKLDTKPIGYFKDALLRFKKNKSSVVAFAIICVLVLFAVFAPMFSQYTVDQRDGFYATALPKNQLLSKIGIWDGTKWRSDAQGGFDYYNAIGAESGMSAVVGVPKETTGADGRVVYNYKVDTYYQVGYTFKTLPKTEYEQLLAYQESTGVQVFYPLTVTHATAFNGFNNANMWYQLDPSAYSVGDDGSVTTTGLALRDGDGNYIHNYLTDANITESTTKKAYTGTRIDGDDGSYVYAAVVQGGYKVRINYYEYYTFINGHVPSFLFGANGYGQDVFTCLAGGARLSFLLAIFVSMINLTIGAIYGAIEGYYGGAIDMTMERISDILASVPFIVVATLFQLHLAEKAGPLLSLLFAFVLTGWVGMASRVRMQFYRFKGQEYILAARTLGARDSRLMFKHIFPNSIGTIITGAVLSIPGVIFSESMLSFLGIINLETSSMTSVGTMLSQGQGYLTTHPHIILFPAIFISLLEISFNLFGNGLRDALNPSLRGVEE